MKESSKKENNFRNNNGYLKLKNFIFQRDVYRIHKNSGFLLKLRKI